jgi:activator of HSP90 ATPase
MAKTIRQTVTLTASPEALFETYLDSEKHAAVIGGKVSISRKAGATFTAFDGGLRGRNLLIIPKRMIVQSWRASTWKKSDPDSLLILQFSKAGAGGQVKLTHVNVPNHTCQIIKNGWPEHYWKP